MAGLTELQTAFCRYYLTGMTATQAAKEAGYNPRTAGRTAHENLQKPAIKAELARLRGQLEKKAIVTAEDVLKGLLKEARSADNDSARVTAWAHLGKHLGMFTDKHEVTIKKPPAEMTDAELAQALQDAGLL